MVRGRTRIFNVRVTDGTGAAYILGTGEKLIFGVKKNYFDSGYLIKKSITSVNATSEPGGLCCSYQAGGHGKSDV